MSWISPPIGRFSGDYHWPLLGDSRGASVLARWLCGIYGPLESAATVAIMIVLASILVAIAGVMLGELWSSAWEIYRLSAGHMSYRATRIPWTHHRVTFFIAGLLSFLAISAIHRPVRLVALARQA